MKMVKSLLLGTCAGVIACAGAYAKDLPTTKSPGINAPHEETIINAGGSRKIISREGWNSPQLAGTEESGGKLAIDPGSGTGGEPRTCSAPKTS